MTVKKNYTLKDVFSTVAAERADYRANNLVTPLPVRLPNKTIKADTLSPNTIFKPLKKMSNAKELEGELNRQRKRYKPFMDDLAPVLTSPRKQIALCTFDWRIETGKDQENANWALSGKGQWDQVAIPHYGEPLGKATTYYRTTFKLTQKQIRSGALFICFKGVDYKSTVFINGHMVGTNECFFNPFEFDFTGHALVGENVLLVKVDNDYVMNVSPDSQGRERDGDKIYAATGLGYDDPERGWHHCPPGMGIYNDVYVDIRPRTYLSDIFVRPLPETRCAQAWLQIGQCDLEPTDVIVELSLYGQNFKKTVFKDLRFEPRCKSELGLGDDLQYAKDKAAGILGKPVDMQMGGGMNELRIEFDMPDFRWWELETPWLYQLQVRLLDKNGKLIDTGKQQFGMRTFKIDAESDPKGKITLNGRPIRLRGANTMGHEQQCAFKRDFDQLRDDILLAKICNMNYLRLTQRPVQKEIYEYCDRLGLMVQTDLPTFGAIHRSQYMEALRQVHVMTQFVRTHPSVVLLSYINEPMPNSRNKPHRNISRAELTDFFVMADTIVRQLHPEMATKPTDGDYDPPSNGLSDRHCYTTWYNGQGVDVGMLNKGYWQPSNPGWHYACGEFGAEGLDPINLMKKEYPASWVKEVNGKWTPDKVIRQQSGMFHYFFYDTPETMEQWVHDSQAYQAFATRFMAEAFRRDNRMVSFAIHLFIDAFPSGWMKTIMDCWRQPKQAYFAYRDALAPLLPNLRTDRFMFTAGETIQLEAWVCNDRPDTDNALSLHYQFEMDGKVFAAGRQKAGIESCNSTFQGYLKLKAPKVETRKKITARLALVAPKGKVVNDSSIELDVFPRHTPKIARTVYLLDKSDAAGAALCRELGIMPVILKKNALTDSTILINDFKTFTKHKASVLKAVKNGARAIFMQLPPGIYSIGNDPVEIKNSSFNPLHFASRKTGHSMVDGFEKNDFRYWYAPAEDRIAAFLETTFAAEGYTPILTSGNLDKNGNWHSEMAVGEKKLGQGSIILCQIELTGRTKHNPPAKVFAGRILS